jgi:hypothetical protein
MEEDVSARRAFIQDLREGREYQNKTLEEVAQTTHISLAYLRALEEDRWDAIPAPFLRGYLTSYAECLGLYREKVLKRFDELDWRPAAEHPGSAWRPDSSRPTPEEAPAPDGRAVPAKPLVPTFPEVIPVPIKALAAGLALALALALVLGVVWLLPEGDDGEAAEAELATHTEAVLESARVQQLTFRRQRGGPVTLTVGGARVFHGPLRADSLLSVSTPKEVDIQVDRLEDLRVTLDGRPLDVPADSGSAELRVWRGVAGLTRRSP